MYNTFNRSQTDWFYAKSRIEDFLGQNKDAHVLLDGRSSQPIKFYLGNNLGKNHKTYTWESKDDLYKFFVILKQFSDEAPITL